MQENTTVNYGDFLLFGLQHYGLVIQKIEGKHIFLEQDYTIEFERESLYKLSHQNKVIAPFDSVESLCEFIIEDKKQSL